jgi:hypothetical protein
MVHLNIEVKVEMTWCWRKQEDNHPQIQIYQTKTQIISQQLRTRVHNTCDFSPHKITWIKTLVVMKANSKCEQLIISLFIVIRNSRFQIQRLHFFRGNRKSDPFICKVKLLWFTIIILYLQFIKVLCQSLEIAHLRFRWLMKNWVTNNSNVKFI